MSLELNARDGDPGLSLAQCQQRVRRFLADEASFAQVVTVNRAGFPVGRSMVAPVDDDWSVPLVQRSVHHRIGQWRRNPATEIIWQGSPRRDNRNLFPHVYDWCVQAPRVVFLRGTANFMDADELVEVFAAQSEKNRQAGRTLAPERDRDNVIAELVGVRVRPIQIRAEGFGNGPESVTWHVGDQDD